MVSFEIIKNYEVLFRAESLISRSLSFSFFKIYTVKRFTELSARVFS
jgi:hypothetical protein